MKHCAHADAWRDTITYPMNPKFLFFVFAWIAIIALSFSVISDFWLPMLLGALLVTFLSNFADHSRH